MNKFVLIYQGEVKELKMNRVEEIIDAEANVRIDSQGECANIKDFNRKIKENTLYQVALFCAIETSAYFGALIRFGFGYYRIWKVETISPISKQLFLPLPGHSSQGGGLGEMGLLRGEWGGILWKVRGRKGRMHQEQETLHNRSRAQGHGQSAFLLPFPAALLLLLFISFILLILC
jgi:hypothetical protein